MQALNRYWDREHAGQALASDLLPLLGGARPIVVGLPRGGLVVAAEVARLLDAPLDFCAVRKLAADEHSEVSFGAIATGGVQVLDRQLVHDLALSPAEMADIVAREKAELERLELLLGAERSHPSLTGRTAILVDDGAATGKTLRAAAAAARLQFPQQLVIATPVASREAGTLLGAAADVWDCPMQPEPLHAVGLWYVHFPMVPEEEARHLLAQSAHAGCDRRG